MHSGRGSAVTTFNKKPCSGRIGILTRISLVLTTLSTIEFQPSTKFLITPLTARTANIRPVSVHKVSENPPQILTVTRLFDEESDDCELNSDKEDLSSEGETDMED